MDDIFPSRTSQQPEQLVHSTSRKELRKMLRYILGNFDVRALIPCLTERKKLYYKRVEKDDKLMEHFEKLGLESTKRYNPDLEKIWWQKLEKRFRRTFSRNGNIDRRLCYVWDNNNFLVKYGFTFGVRQVQDDTCHIYQLTQAPLFLYKLPAEENSSVVSRFKTNVMRTEGCFNQQDQNKYDQCILESNTCYRIPAKTLYVLIAPQKALFSVHILDANQPISFECKVPTVARHSRLRDTYSPLPETPALSQLPLESNNSTGCCLNQLVQESFPERELPPQQPAKTLASTSRGNSGMKSSPIPVQQQQQQLESSPIPVQQQQQQLESSPIPVQQQQQQPKSSPIIVQQPSPVKEFAVTVTVKISDSAISEM